MKCMLILMSKRVVGETCFQQLRQKAQRVTKQKKSRNSEVQNLRRKRESSKHHLSQLPLQSKRCAGTASPTTRSDRGVLTAFGAKAARTAILNPGRRKLIWEFRNWLVIIFS